VIGLRREFGTKENPTGQENEAFRIIIPKRLAAFKFSCGASIERLVKYSSHWKNTILFVIGLMASLCLSF
jgi:hypothetical protein